VPDVLHDIAQELQLVDLKIKEGLIIKKSGHAGQFAHLESSRLEGNIRPAVTILSAKLFNFKREEIIVLASIMQYIYMAFQVQARITEQDTLPENGDVRDGCQFPVLVGDYLYGKFFRLLSDANIIKYLQPLAKIICSLNEGATVRNQHPNVNFTTAPDLIKGIVYKETAILFAGCASLAAEISDANETEIQKMYNFGLHFGLGFGLLEQGASYEYVDQYFNKAILLLEDFSDSGNLDLIRLVNMFKHKKIIVEKMVV
jgi:geranylgeranyl pyrophosphate synthase